MRILYITPAFQHPKMRGPTRHYHFIRELSRRHAITLLTLTRSTVAAEAMQEMVSYTERILTFNANGASNPYIGRAIGHLPFIGDRIGQILQLREGVRQMKRAFMQLVQQESYDLVLFHGKSVFSVIDAWHNLPIVADFCDATSMRVRTKMSYVGMVKRPLFALRYLQVRQIEKKLLRKTPHLAFISCRDRDAILGPSSRAKILPIGVDHGYWTRKTHNPHPHCIVYTGVMDYPPNADGALYLLDKILPLLRRAVPNIEVLIVGRDPAPALLELARGYPDVTITGFVDDMRPYLERAAVYVAPLRFASGMQNKLLEAMAMEIPVVTTPIAAAGLRVEDGTAVPLLVADGEAQFAECVVRLLKQEAERSRLAVDGKRFVERYFNWPRSAQMLEEMCMEAVAQGQ